MYIIRKPNNLPKNQGGNAVKTKKTLALFLSLILFLTQMPLNLVLAEEIEPETFDITENQVKLLIASDKEFNEVVAKKGIEFDITALKLRITGVEQNKENSEPVTVTILENGKDISDNMFEIEIKTSSEEIGEEGDDNKAEKNVNQESTSEQSDEKPTEKYVEIVFSLKEGKDQQKIKLKPLTLYTIAMPQSLLIDDEGKVNNGFLYNFVTKGEEGQKDILKTTTPRDGEKLCKNPGEIVFEFVDNITFTASAEIQVSVEPLGSDKTTGSEGPEDPENPEEPKDPDSEEVPPGEKFSINENKLFIDISQNEEIKNLIDKGKDVKITVEIKEGTICLEADKNIANDKINISFTLHNLLINNIEPSSISIFELQDGKNTFKILGQGFSAIKNPTIDLTPISGSAGGEGVIQIASVKIENDNTIIATLSDDNKKALIGQNGGTYRVTIKSGDEKLLDSPINLKIISRGKPKVLRKHPEGGIADWFNEKELFPTRIDGKTRYFLKVVFEDKDETLQLSDNALNLIKDSSVFSQGQTQMSMIDTELINYIQNLDKEAQKQCIDKYIFIKSTKEASLYIPVKPLRVNTTYTVILNPGIVHFKGDKSQTNDSITWTFSTMPIPVVTGIYLGSVPEDYDEDEPVILYGDSFSENAEVYFNDIKAEKVKLKYDVNGNPYLEAYLPTRRDRLDPGIYTIKVRNDRDHEFEIYGSFSVVEEGRYIPNEDYRVKDEYRKGEIRGEITVSEDTLRLDRYYTDRRYVEIDLDDLMREEVLVRNIQFNPRRRDSIGELETFSKWADITLYDVRESRNADDDVKIKLGRVEPAMAQTIKRKLGALRVKSEIIQVTGENYDVGTIKIIIPYRESDGKNLKLYRYDLDDRTFYEENCYIDEIDKTVKAIIHKRGIFVVIEDPRA